MSQRRQVVYKHLSDAEEAESSNDFQHSSTEEDETHSGSDLSSTSSLPATGAGAWRICPPDRFVFRTVLFRELLYRMQKHGMAQKGTGAVHVAVFRRYVERLAECLNPTLQIDWDAFGSEQHKVWLKWEDIRPGVIEKAVPAVEINIWERIHMTLEDPSSCILGTLYFVVSLSFIVASIVGVVVESAVTQCPWPPPSGGCWTLFDTTCVLYFTADYMIRLVCSFQSRVAIFDQDWLLHKTVHDQFSSAGGSSNATGSPLHRAAVFIIKPLNLVDVISILPFWVQVLSGGRQIPLAFLRIIRTLRFFRVLKLGKFNTTLQLLGTTLVNSTQMVYVIVIYVALTCLVAGAIMNQIEGSSHVQTWMSVHQAAWWITSRMVNGGWRSMMDVNENVVGYPTTVAGSAVITLCFILKGIIWLLPFAMIGETFKSAWNDNQELTKLRRDVELEDTRQHSVWIESASTAVAPIEVWEASSECGTLAGVGTIPVPILESTARSGVVTTTLWGGSMQSWFGSTATMEFQVTWHPTAVKDGGSHGQLSIEPLMGKNFKGPEGATWKCTVRAPLGVPGCQADKWQSRCSSKGPEPRWNCPGGTFDICLNVFEGSGGKFGLQKAVILLEAQGGFLGNLSKRAISLEQRTTAIEQIISAN